MFAWRPHTTAALICCVVALVFPSGAAGALWLMFDRATASPGDVIRARLGGRVNPDDFRGGPPLRVFLVPAGGESSRNLTFVGEIQIGAEGEGILTFVVPNLPSGRYRTVIECNQCVAQSAGRRLLPSGPTAGLFIREDETDRSMLRRLLVAGGGVLGLCAGLFALKRWHPKAAKSADVRR